MKEITIFIDNSGSMSVLGKDAIVAYLKQTLLVFQEFHSEDVVFSFQDFDFEESSVIKILNTASLKLFITDGFLQNDVLKNFEENGNSDYAVFLVGVDSNLVRKKCTGKNCFFSGSDILNCIDYLCGDL